MIKKLTILLTIILISGCDHEKKDEIEDEIELLEVNKKRIVNIEFSSDFYKDDTCHIIIDLEYGGKTRVRLNGASCKAFIRKK